HPPMIEVGVGEEHRGEITRARPEHVQDAYQQRPRAGKTCIDEGKAVVSFEQVAIGVGDPQLEDSRADLDSALLSIIHPASVRGRGDGRKSVASRGGRAIMSTPRTGAAKLLACGHGYPTCPRLYIQFLARRLPVRLEPFRTVRYRRPP